MLKNRAELKTEYFQTKRLCVFCALSLIAIALPLEASNIANQRFLDNAIQFDDDEGLRTRSEGPGLPDESQLKQSAGVIVVTVSRNENVEKQKPESRGGFSFSDMAKSTQKAQGQRSGLSFGDMARSARRPKPRLQLRNKSQKVTTSDRTLLSR